MSGSQLLDLAEASRLLGTPPTTVARWVRQGLLSCRAGRDGPHFERAELQAWARLRGLKPGVTAPSPPAPEDDLLTAAVARGRWISGLQASDSRELAEQGDLLRPGTDRRILADVSVRESLDAEVTTVREDLSLTAFARVVKDSRRNHFPVLAPDGETLVGMLDLATVRQLLLDPEVARVTLVGTMMTREPDRVQAPSSLAQAMEVFEETGAWVLPVVEGTRFVGLISRSTLFDVYRHELSVQMS